MNYYEKYVKAYNQTPKGKYIRQKANAKARGIVWEFTFETWMKLWLDSGKWEQRGTGPEDYCMARIWDLGPYSMDNVKIVKTADNTKAALKQRWHGWEQGPESCDK